MIDSRDYWLKQVLAECQNTLVYLQYKYSKEELAVAELPPEDLVAINIASGFVTLYRLAADNDLIEAEEETVIH